MAVLYYYKNDSYRMILDYQWAEGKHRLNHFLCHTCLVEDNLYRSKVQLHKLNDAFVHKQPKMTMMVKDNWVMVLLHLLLKHHRLLH